MARAAPDPGPPPEGVGLVVRPLTRRATGGGVGEIVGFYARIHPRPPVPWRKLALTLVGFGGVGAVLARLVASDVFAGAEMVVGIALFGVLLGAFAHGAGYFPVEVAADDDAVAWSGDRFALAAVGGCAQIGDRLELRDPAGRVLAAIDGVDPRAGAWVAAAIEASLPARG